MIQGGRPAIVKFCQLASCAEARVTAGPSCLTRAIRPCNRPSYSTKRNTKSISLSRGQITSIGMLVLRSSDQNIKKKQKVGLIKARGLKVGRFY